MWTNAIDITHAGTSTPKALTGYDDGNFWFELSGIHLCMDREATEVLAAIAESWLQDHARVEAAAENARPDVA